MQVSTLNEALRVVTRQPAASSGQDADDSIFAGHLSEMADAQKDETSEPVPSISPTMQASARLASVDYAAQDEAAKPSSLLLDDEKFSQMRADGTLNGSIPNIAEFMERTGVDFKTAAFFLGGAIGRAPDMRDWAAIMASDDPLAAARRATGELLGPGEHSARIKSELEDMGYKPVAERDVVAHAGNFAVVDNGTSKAGQRLALQIVDDNGHLGVPVEWDEDAIRNAGRDFGISLAPLADIAAQLDVKGVNFLPWQMIPGTDISADLVALAEDR
jgi:hypothetical protein